MSEEIEVRMVTADDAGLILAQTEGLFDAVPDPDETSAFLGSDLCEMAIAVRGDTILSFASGSILLHPDKDPSMFINEVGTRDEWVRKGLATKVTNALIDCARARECDGIWLGTEPENEAALGLYRQLGAKEQIIVGFAWDGAFDLD